MLRTSRWLRPAAPTGRTVPAVDQPYCDQCGGAVGPGAADPVGHERCTERRRLEPPRYCAACRRRMVVQVTPRGWTARCAEHGLRTGTA